MANFNAHIATSATLAGTGTLILLSTEMPLEQAVLLFCLGALGGILPDIDADHSTALGLAYNLFAILISFFVALRVMPFFSILVVLLIGFGCFLFLRLVVFQLFMRATVHRGIFHSLPAGFVFGFLIVATLHYGFEASLILAWLGGIFVWIGFISHLLLDELASLSLFREGGVKRSFGTAFKLFSRNLVATISIYLALSASYYMTPEFPAEALNTLWQQIEQTSEERFWPEALRHVE
ncbi:metal-dependent hydrolase [Magnetococcales bacterium HHB-1]